MAQKMTLNLSMKQQLRMTQQLQQAIKMLQLSRLELIDTIHEELVDNVMLEESTDGEDANTSEFVQLESGEPTAEINEGADLGSSLRELDKNIDENAEIDWNAYLNDYQTHTPVTDAGSQGYIGEEMPSYEATLSAPPTLVENLIRQIKFSRMNDKQRRIAYEIVGNINEDGFLTDITLEEIAEKLSKNINNNNKYNSTDEITNDIEKNIVKNHSSTDEDVEEDDQNDVNNIVATSNNDNCNEIYTLQEVEQVQKMVMELDPSGVGARDLRECLLAQAEQMYPDNNLVITILSDYMPQLERRNYDLIARGLKTTLTCIKHAITLIGTLNPRPGSKYSDAKPMYITPDVFVERTADGEYHVVVNNDGLPRLRVSKYYTELLREGNANDASNYIREKMGNAKWFIRSIQQRERTIYRVTEAIIARQRDFFEKGVQYLRPMILKDIADDTELSESTISRVTTQKYVHTPQGTFELKFFFNAKINRMDNFAGEDVASTAVRERIKQLIDAENPKKPLSDQKIVEILQNENIDIARRTVAKYREAMGILSSSQRKEL